MLPAGRDLRYAIRSLCRTPGATSAAIVALTLGVGLTTTMFSIVYGVLLRGLPVPDGDQIVIAYRDNPARGETRQGIPLTVFEDYRREQRSLAGLGGYTSGAVNVGGDSPAWRAPAAWVTGDVFRVLQVPPLLGRVIGPADEGPDVAPVVVLSFGAWQDRFSGRRDILSRVVRVDGLPYSVVGVMPRGFAFPDAEALWLPLRARLTEDRDAGPTLVALGRLKPGAHLGTARADLQSVARRLADRYPRTDGAFTATAGTFNDWSIGPQPRRLLLAMLGAVFCVFLVSCVNVMNLLIGRAAARVQEFGIRIALGASRAQLARQILTEALVLAAAGVVGGSGVASLGIGVFHRATLGTNFPSFVQVNLFPPVLVFTAGIGGLATLLSGLLPALRASSRDIGDVLKDASRGASSLSVSRINRGLIGLEVALSGALLVAAGLMIETVVNARTVHYGYAATSVLTGAVAFPETDAETTLVREARRITDEIQTIPEVRGAAIASGLPGLGLEADRLAVEGVVYPSEDDQPIVNSASVTPGFFGALEVSASRGRLLFETDRAGTVPVAVVTERLARRLFPHEPPVGRRVKLGASAWCTIVGVVPDMFGGDPSDPYPAIVFRPFVQAPSHSAFVAVRAAAGPLHLVQPVRSAIARVNADLPLDQPASLAQAITDQLWFLRVFGAMFVVFGVAALALAAVGLYAVTSFWVGQRTREIGIRMALGAGRPRVLGLVLGQGAVPVISGLLVGLALALGGSQLLADILFDVQPWDPVVYGGVASALTLCAFCACLVPAVRATGLNPVSALRRE